MIHVRNLVTTTLQSNFNCNSVMLHAWKFPYMHVDVSHNNSYFTTHLVTELIYASNKMILIFKILYLSVTYLDYLNNFDSVKIIKKKFMYSFNLSILHPNSLIKRSLIKCKLEPNPNLKQITITIGSQLNFTSINL